MFRFPARKCIYIIKVAILSTLVIALITFFEQWRGGKRVVNAVFSDPIEAEYEKQILEDEARIIPGLGDGGVAAYLTGEDKRLGEESEKKLAMNVYLSDRIAYNRTLKDYRNPACDRVIYDAELPSVSVILIFHNEPYSVVIRTIWSVINSARRDQPWYSKANFVERSTGRTMQLGYPGQDPTSPFVYLKEIILVDDNSTLPELKGKLSYYVRTRLPPDLIRILRLPDRVGLIRARLAGARYATSDTMVFLDSHCEPQRDWLRPLLQELKTSTKSVLVPIIDVIDHSNFYYSVQETNSFQVGGFTFTGHFMWIDVPEREKKRRGSDIAPTWSPTMAGGLFAINRAYFWELGAYDEQMAGWGGENLEMSFRIWQCGGTLETVPCSRVGHVFRSFHPYGLPAQSDTHGINTARMAEVWMDEYAELYYLHRPDLRNNPKIGDVTHRKILREKLKCKSFQWFLDNIYEDKFVPVRDVYGFGRFKNPASGFCLDTMQRDGEAAPLGVYPCHSTLQATQYLSLSLAGELRGEERCVQVQFTRREKNDYSPQKVVMTTCHGKQRDQKWRYIPSTSQLKHVSTGLCLDAGFESGADATADATASACDERAQQKWNIDYAEYNNFSGPDGEMSERDEKLRKLTGQRRKSRSLLSYDEKSRRHTHKRKSKKKKKDTKRKNKKKDKFILKLLRTRNNGTEEHLEVDIHCKHRKLYPNNTFVRDIVTILNDKDIKVINNGRLFERNKVTDLKDVEIKKMKVKDHDKMEDYEENVTKKSKHKKYKTTPSIERNMKRVPAVNMAAATHKQADNKIIIEEFVAVKPDRKIKKHKRKHNRATPPPPTTEREGGELLPGTKKHFKSEEVMDTPMLSSEDTPMLMDKDIDRKVNTIVREDSDRENWPVGESRFRRNNSHYMMQPIRRQDMEINDGSYEKSMDDSENKDPVKVVLRSNLTFNIGDDFFAWRPNDKNEQQKEVKTQPMQLLIKPNTAYVEKLKSSKTDRKPVKPDKLDVENIDQFDRQSNAVNDDSLDDGFRHRADDNRSDGSSSSSESCDD